MANKPLPFKNKLECVAVDSYEKILKELKNTSKKAIVVDDAQYIMANEFMRRATERGYDKFTEIAFHMWDIVESVKDLPADTVVYFLSHIDRDSEGNEKVKTIGKLLDEKITLEGMFTIVLKTNVSDGQYTFLTQNSGKDTVKSPIGLFGSYAIENDLKYVDEKIRNYYELGDFLSDEEIAEIDAEAERVDVIKDEKKSRRSRGTDTEPARRSRKDIIKDNEAKIANAGIAEAEGADAVDFDKVETPELEPVPRKTAEDKVETKTRKRRTAPVENAVAPLSEDLAKDAEAVEETVMNEPEEQATTTRRRRRRD